MRRGGGHSKGSAFERWVCKRLSAWHGGPDDLFWRTAGSGSRQTRGKHRIHQAGDVGALSPKVKWFTDAFLLECKSYRKLDWSGLIFRDTGNILDFWYKLRKSCEDFKPPRWPMLIAKENRVAPVVCLDIEFKVKIIPGTPLISLYKHHIVVYWLEQLLSISPEHLRTSIIDE